MAKRGEMLANAVRAKSPALIPAGPTGSGSSGQQVRSDVGRRQRSSLTDTIWWQISVKTCFY